MESCREGLLCAGALYSGKEQLQGAGFYPNVGDKGKLCEADWDWNRVSVLEGRYHIRKGSDVSGVFGFYGGGECGLKWKSLYVLR